MLKGDTAPGFTIDLAHKDLTLVVEAANAARVPMPMAAAAREAFSVARSRGFGGQDFSAMVDAACDVAGIDKATPAGVTAAGRAPYAAGDKGAQSPASRERTRMGLRIAGHHG